MCWCSESSSGRECRARETNTQVGILTHTHTAGSHFVLSIRAGFSQPPRYRQSESRGRDGGGWVEKKIRLNTNLSRLIGEQWVLKCCNATLSLALLSELTKDSFGKGDDVEMYNGDAADMYSRSLSFIVDTRLCNCSEENEMSLQMFL